MIHPILTRLKRIGFGLAMSALAGSSLQAQTVQFNLETATLDDVQKAMQAGALSSVDLTAIYIKRISAYSEDGYPYLNAIMIPNPAALEEAAAADKLRASGRVLGPLHGVPFMVKGSYGVKGMPLTGGLNQWFDQVSPFDCFVVQKLKAAGGVFLGYANMDTFASSASSTNSQIAGTAMNAYVPGYSASGSSGGSAVSAGANLAFFTFGGETGGSIRGPSDRAGIVGFKTSTGCISVSGILALVAVRDVVGPMTRSTIDNAKIMDIVTQFDPNDIWAPVFQIPGRARPSGFEAKIAATPNLIQKRFVVIPNWMGAAYPGPTPAGSTANTTGVTTPDAEVTALFTEARASLASIGATVIESYLPAEADTGYTLRHLSVPAAVVTPPTRTLNVAPNSTNVTAYEHKTLLEALNFKTGDTVEQLAAKVFQRADTSNGNISDATKAAMYSFDANGMVTGTSVINFSNPIAQEYFKAQEYIIKDLENWMTANQIDAIIIPTSTSKTRTANNSPGGFRDLVNNMGLPVVTVPMGVLSTGEPLTMAFIGRHNSDADLLAYAHAYEQISKKRISSPLAPALPEESFSYTIGATRPPAARPETTPPVVSIGKASSDKSRLLVRGSAADQSGVASVTVSVKGEKLPVSGKDKWTASVNSSLLSKLVKKSTKKLKVLVTVRDLYGNTTTVSEFVKVPEGLTES